jgi:hypothetical protein
MPRSVLLLARSVCASGDTLFSINGKKLAQAVTSAWPRYAGGLMPANFDLFSNSKIPPRKTSLYPDRSIQAINNISLRLLSEQVLKSQLS